jgi:predicted peroxiredoxin
LRNAGLIPAAKNGKPGAIICNAYPWFCAPRQYGFGRNCGERCKLESPALPVNSPFKRRPCMSEHTSQSNRELVVLLTRGTDHELSSVAFTVACGGITSGMKVYAFLVSSAVDLVRRKAVDVTHVPPLDPLKKLMEDFIARGGTIWVCPLPALRQGSWLRPGGLHRRRNHPGRQRDARAA